MIGGKISQDEEGAEENQLSGVINFYSLQLII
jgi:hypothetical protein